MNLWNDPGEFPSAPCQWSPYLANPPKPVPPPFLLAPLCDFSTCFLGSHGPYECFYSSAHPLGLSLGQGGVRMAGYVGSSSTWCKLSNQNSPGLIQPDMEGRGSPRPVPGVWAGGSGSLRAAMSHSVEDMEGVRNKSVSRPASESENMASHHSGPELWCPQGPAASLPSHSLPGPLFCHSWGPSIILPIWFPFSIMLFWSGF